MMGQSTDCHDVSIEHCTLPHIGFNDKTEIPVGSSCDTYMSILSSLDLDSTAIIGEACQNLILAARAQKSIRLYTNTGSAMSSNNDFHYVEVTESGDIFLSNGWGGADQGIIMKSPNGNCWKKTVDDNGNWVTTQVGCPSTF